MEARQIVVSEALRAALYDAARAAYPNECCGWLTATSLRPCHNAQATAAHPTTINRSAETAYVIDGDDLIAFASAFAGGDLPLAVYHSHPNGRAYFSPTDRACALDPWGDGPAYPVAHIVVGVAARGVTEVAVFAWCDEARDFVETDRWNVI
ncbi:MAG: Mov34/MPN/PAD-1 family protein [Myxococcales bacterium]|nr:Mov34/MPN/PAD-1 family protein [Myxococcales bacterium]